MTSGAAVVQTNCKDRARRDQFKRRRRLRIRLTGEHEDADGMAIEPFALRDNLMLAGSVLASGGCIVAEATPHAERYTSFTTFERCVMHAAAILLR